jgi:hypothetical protein
MQPTILYILYINTFFPFAVISTEMIEILINKIAPVIIFND